MSECASHRLGGKILDADAILQNYGVDEVVRT